MIALSLELTALLMHLGIQSKALGIKKNAFGGAGVSNVGVFNCKDGSAPLSRK